MTKNENNSIFIISQYFYGNRTGTEVELDWIDPFLRGHISRNHYSPLDAQDVQNVIRKIVHIPGSEHIVIVYDQAQEDRYVNIEFPEIYATDGADYLARWGEELKMHVSCEIPEIGFKIHTRCFACRADKDGTLHSLENGDIQKFIHYFPAR